MITNQTNQNLSVDGIYDKLKTDEAYQHILDDNDAYFINKI